MTVEVSDHMHEQIEAMIRSRVHPVIKWAGGKTNLLRPVLAQIVPYLRDGAYYYEPFVGGASVFFALQPRRAILNDRNVRLISMYVQIKRKAHRVLSDLYAIQKQWSAKDGVRMGDMDSESYYALRIAFNVADPRIVPAAWFIALNKTCFNGLYRENRAKEFNVPFGRYKRIAWPTIEDIMSAQSALNKVERFCSVDFAKVLELYPPSAGDVIYCDPPYLGMSDTANFTSYTADGFNMHDHERLFAMAKWAAKRGARCVISQGPSPLLDPFVHDPTLQAIPVRARRSISSDGGTRNDVNEWIFVASPESVSNARTPGVRSRS